jgi:predicted SnoaL-like aldol condensation-catalyzing enzyme
MLMTLIAAAAAATCQPGSADNRRIVESFYRQALVAKQPKAAFETYVARDFVEHKPDVAEPTRDSVAGFLTGLVSEMPDARWEIVRTIADDDLVALHVRFTPAPAAPAYAIVDIFRVKDCKIVEHWDVVAGPPKEQANPNPRF